MRRVAVFALTMMLLAMAACGGGSSAPPAISVAISPGTAQTIDQGQTKSFTATASNDSANAGVTWSASGASCTGTECGSLSGTTNSAATYNAPATVTSSLVVTVTATSVTDTSKSASVQVTVMPAPSVNTASLPGGTVGVAYSATLAATGGVTPYTWSVSSGTLPAGLSLNASSGAITGTPTTAGTSNITVQVTDSASPALSATKDLSITIAPAPLVISTTSLPGGTVNSTYSASLASTGGTGAVTWSVTVGSLPAGLALNASTGAITGAPTAAGTVDFTVTATDSGTPTPQAVDKALSIAVNPVLSVTTATLADATVDTAYSGPLASNGGTAPVTWSVTAGTLPAGLTLNATTGAITGTPTTAAATPVAFTVQAADSSTPQQTATAALSILVHAKPLSITTTTLPTGAVNSDYSATLASTGGLAPITWAVTVGTLPNGLTLDASTGEISGIPTAEGTTDFTVTATDASIPALTAVKALSITVNASLTVTTTTLPDGTVGAAYNQTVQSNGGIAPITWSVTAGALPGGLTLNTSTGAITGTATAAGTFNFTLQAADAGTPQQFATAALSINIAAAPLVISTSTLPNGTVGTAYNTTLEITGGTAPVTWAVTVGSLPAGITLDANTGVLSGTPTTAASSSFTVTATDSSVPAKTDTQALAITVDPGGTNNSELNGQYAFMFSGFNQGGYSAVAGKLTADGAGHITSGVLDAADGSGLTSNEAFTGTYAIGADHRGTMTISSAMGDSSVAFAVGGITSGVGAFGSLIQTDATSWNSGMFKKQDTSAFSLGGVAGDFAFGGSGMGDGAGTTGFAMAGRFTLNGSGGISSGSVDVYDSSGASGVQTFTGTYTVGTNGRGTTSLTVGPDTVHMVFYVVSANEFFTVAADPAPSGNAIWTAQMKKQSGTFNDGSLNATAVIIGQSLNTSGSSTEIGLVTGNAGGSATVSIEQNNAGTLSTVNDVIVYTTTSNGRVAFGGGGPVFYLISANRGFGVGTEEPEALRAEPRAAGPYNNAYLTGSFIFGTLPPVMSTSAVESGAATFNGSGGISGTYDDNDAGTVTSGAVTETYTVNADGTVTFGSGEEVGYIVNGSKVFLMSINPNNHPAISVIEK